MTVLTAASTSSLKAGRSLVDRALFDRMVARIAVEHPDLDDDMPARIMDQALAFLAACATTTQPLGPSDQVDIGWHTFVLYTRAYAEFSDRIAGRFIHHEPDDGGPRSPGPTIPEAVPLQRAMDAIRGAGYALDEDLWAGRADCNSKCHQCHAGCHDSPGGFTG
jgi:hypothetical protein